MQVEQRLDRIFEKIATESSKQRADRWRGLYDRIAAPLGEKLALFGAGEFGQLVLRRLRTVGVEPCCFSDNNRSVWNTTVNGVEVISPAVAVERYGQTASFVVTVFNGSSAIRQLTEMGCKRVLPATPLFWKYSAEFMPDLGIGEPERIVEDEEHIRQCFTLFADDTSRKELCDQISWRYWMEPQYLPLPQNSGEIYFPTDLVKDNDTEVFVDCGAYDGDSIRSFLRRGHSFSHWYALEPDAQNRALLSNFIATLPADLQQKLTVWPYAAGNMDGQVSFVATGDVASKVSSSKTGLSIESRKLDSLPLRFTPTYIKMDIEGAEPDALAGAVNLLRSAQPVLAICLYHRLEHLWQIPNLIHCLSPGYSIFLRRYAEDGWEQVCYAVPQGRLVY